MLRAMRVYQNEAIWQALQLRGMRRDFSWERSAQEYLRLYQELSYARQKRCRLKFKLQIAAPLDEVYSTFTNGTAFCEWLCDVAQVDARLGGHLYLWWESGYFVNGEYLELTPGRKNRFFLAWRRRAGCYAGQSYFQSASQMGLALVLSHQGIGSENAWKKMRKEFKQSWKHALENLKSVLESGQDLRFLNRPRLGFCELQELSAEQAAQAGLPETRRTAGAGCGRRVVRG